MKHTNSFWGTTNRVIKNLMDTSSLNWRRGSKTKVYKYHGVNAKEKFIRDQTQNSSIYKESKTYLSEHNIISSNLTKLLEAL